MWLLNWMKYGHRLDLKIHVMFDRTVPNEDWVGSDLIRIPSAIYQDLSLRKIFNSIPKLYKLNSVRPSHSQFKADHVQNWSYYTTLSLKLRHMLWLMIRIEWPGLDVLVFSSSYCRRQGCCPGMQHRIATPAEKMQSRSGLPTKLNIHESWSIKSLQM